MKTKQKMGRRYQNFGAAIYCPVMSINQLEDMEQFWKDFGLLYENIKINKVYLECHRGIDWITREQLIKVKNFFEDKGIETAGGITTNDEGTGEGFESLCYTSQRGQQIIRQAVELCAEVFDEFIFDDFYFANCRCSKCVKEKGSRTWSEFRLEQKRNISKEIVMKTAKRINPDVKVIIKFPNWYEAYSETGYDIEKEPEIFDYIYTGTETRNPAYAQQHLPKYLSYFLMRYLENTAPGRNLGGWFDSYECTYNLSSYLEQGYLTLFAKSREVTLFCLGTLMEDSDYRVFPGAAGQMLEETDSYINQLSNPTGVAAYRPYHCSGEDNLHNYLGMCGIPFEPTPVYPKEDVIFLAEGAADDPEIIEKMQNSLEQGADIIVTSGFVKRLGSAFTEFMNISCSDRKAFVQDYAISVDNGLSISGRYRGTDSIIIPQIDYYTNDVWELAAAYGTGNNFPLLLRSRYGNGRVCVITIPDNPGDIYHYPTEVLNQIRKIFCKNLICELEAKSGVMMFQYDNGKIILRSDLPFTETAALVLHEDRQMIKDVLKQRELPVIERRVTLQLSPGVNYLFDLQEAGGEAGNV